jgi:hypothetical protein
MLDYQPVLGLQAVRAPLPARLVFLIALSALFCLTVSESLFDAEKISYLANDDVRYFVLCLTCANLVLGCAVQFRRSTRSTRAAIGCWIFRGHSANDFHVARIGKS